MPPRRTRSPVAATVLLVGETLMAGCVLAGLGGCIEPRAATRAAGIGIPATRTTRQTGSVPTRDSVGEVRFGHGLDVDGKVPPGFGASRFAVGDPIHLSMREGTVGGAGSVVRVSIRDATGRVVWSEAKEAPRGESYLSFAIGRPLPRGTYRADVIVGSEVRSRPSFEVFAWKDR